MWLWLQVLTAVSTEEHASFYFDADYTDVTAENGVSIFSVKEIS